jgi:hypothetical protein
MIIFTTWLPKDYIACAIFPFIFVSSKLKKNINTPYFGRILIHEKIHFKQQRECLIIFFYVLYLLNYVVNLLVYKDPDKAYTNICFEREAYELENFAFRAQVRKKYNYVKYICFS